MYSKIKQFDDIKVGDEVFLMCHYHGCRRELKGICVYPSTGEVYIPKHNRNVDTRNITWTCPWHVGKKKKLNHHRKRRRWMRKKK